VDSLKVTTSGQAHTRFTYTVCQTGPEPIIEHVTLSWKGTCTIVNYAYKSPEFISQRFGIHQDPTTCLVGFQFLESWSSLPSPTCRDLVLVVDGVVPQTAIVDAAIAHHDSHGYYFRVYKVEGPDCMACA